MTTQLTIGDALAAEGMARATAASAPSAIAQLDSLIARYAVTGKPFSSNDLRSQLPAGIKKAAVGARFSHASRQGLIRAVDWVASTDPGTHSHPVRVWQGTRRTV